MKQDNQREDIAYLAGIFDGEGTISMNKQGTKYQPLMSFVNTHRGVVEMMAKLLGAEKIFTHDPGRNGYQNRLVCYKVQVMGTKKPLPILKKLYPYLIIKKELARLAIEFCENVKPTKATRTKFNMTRVPAEEAEWRKSVYEKMQTILHPQRLTRATSSERMK